VILLGRPQTIFGSIIFTYWTIFDCHAAKRRRRRKIGRRAPPLPAGEYQPARRGNVVGARLYPSKTTRVTRIARAVKMQRPTHFSS